MLAGTALTGRNANQQKAPDYSILGGNYQKKRHTAEYCVVLEIVSVEFENFKKERTAIAPAADFWDRANQIMSAKSTDLSKFKEDSG